MAKNLIRKVGNQKGNGMPAEQLDLELSILFRNFNLFQKNMKGDKDDQKRRADSQLGQYEEGRAKDLVKKQEVKEL